MSAWPRTDHGSDQTITAAPTVGHTRYIIRALHVEDSERWRRDSYLFNVPFNMSEPAAMQTAAEMGATTTWVTLQADEYEAKLPAQYLLAYPGSFLAQSIELILEQSAPPAPAIRLNCNPSLLKEVVKYIRARGGYYRLPADIDVYYEVRSQLDYLGISGQALSSSHSRNTLRCGPHLQGYCPTPGCQVPAGLHHRRANSLLCPTHPSFCSITHRPQMCIYIVWP